MPQPTPLPLHGSTTDRVNKLEPIVAELLARVAALEANAGKRSGGIPDGVETFDLRTLPTARPQAWANSLDGGWAPAPGSRHSRYAGETCPKCGRVQIINATANPWRCVLCLKRDTP
jgi:hypothetical protein